VGDPAHAYQHHVEGVKKRGWFSLKELFDTLEQWVGALKQEPFPIIVEGRKDRVALEARGISAIKIQGDLRLFCESVSKTTKDVILLMDHDTKGVELTDKLKRYFGEVGVRVNLFYWRRLKKFHIQHVEALARYDLIKRVNI